MSAIPHNALHGILAAALESRKVPAVFTTNQDRCIEDAAPGSFPVTYDEKGFGLGLRCGLYQFHGATGGNSPEEIARRKQSLTFTLNAMGPNLTEAKRQVLTEAVAKYTLLFLGYSGYDPDIWYSLSVAHVAKERGQRSQIDLWESIRVYMEGCDYGIAVFGDKASNDFNPNV